MIKAVLISAAAGFSLPYFIGLSIPGIPSRSPLIETGLLLPSNSARDAMFSSQVVNRSQKGDKLEVLYTNQHGIEPNRNTVQKTITPEPKIKIGCERPYSGVMAASDNFSRCLADTELLHRTTS